MGNRPRIKKEIIGEVIVDQLSFYENKGSKNARKIVDKSEQMHIEIWYDKHYLSRLQFGEDDGTKRHGINEKIIEDLVACSIKHLICYCFKIKNFLFINFGRNN